jgi:serine/threonine protein phosphatase PrpC
MQGWRLTMEDADVAVGDMGADFSGSAFFGVFDGHGGSAVAEFASKHLPGEVLAKGAAHPADALAAAFASVDERIRSDLQNSADTLGDAAVSRIPRNLADHVGCTANVCLVSKEFITCANAGDSRAVLCRAGKAVPLSVDHKPNDPAERERIHNAGGFVQCTGRGPITHYRVNGNLNLSRSLGDFQYKRRKDLGHEAQIITCAPECKVLGRGAQDEFIILACDGIWDVLSSQDAVDFIRPRLQHCTEISSITQSLLNRCLASSPKLSLGVGCDNMTCVIVDLQPARRPRNSACQDKFVEVLGTPSTTSSESDTMQFDMSTVACPVPAPLAWLSPQGPPGRDDMEDLVVQL